MNPQLKVLTVIFDGEIKSWELPAFRGAVIEKAGRENLLFHNHVGDGYRYAYPLIQYKSVRNQPSLLCLGEGVDEIHHFFARRDWSLRISGRTLDMKIIHLNMDYVTLKAGEPLFPYRIRNWIALNQQSVADFHALKSPVEQTAFLEKKLIGNILSFAKGVGWHVEQQIHLRITQMEDIRPVRVKGVTVQGFNLRFASNVFLPRLIGLGGKVSLGYGVVSPDRPHQSGEEALSAAEPAFPPTPENPEP